jgi:hypothetical protein
MKRFLIAAFVLMLATSAFAQADQQITNPDPCQGTMDIDTCMFGDDGGSGSGSTSGGCQYCYWDNKAPYANCFSAGAGLPYPMYSNCVGTQMCWGNGSGQYCEPWCTGTTCVYA